MANVLEVHNLYKTYRAGFIPKDHPVLKGVDFVIPEGKITGFLGSNGAGKTTTVKCILGLAYPTSGEISYFSGQALSQSVKQRIGFLPEHPYFYNYLTGIEFLMFYGQLSTKLKKKDLKERVDRLLAKMDLTFAGDKQLKDYSKGMLQKIGIAQALIHDPELVILDEPMGGLDPDGRYYVSEIIKETAKQGKAIFFSSHLLHDAEKLCHRLVIIKDGQVAYEGDTASLLGSIEQVWKIRFLQKGLLKTSNDRSQHDQQGNQSQDNLQSEIIKELTVTSPQQLQDEIKKLVSEGLQLVEVIPQRKSLEEAFVDISSKVPRTTGRQEARL